MARSRRTHFARRLLDDTDLTITQVAFAAGFGSVRQLNRAMHDVFRAAPTALRARRRQADRLVADGGLALRLPYRPPFDWAALAGFLRARATPGVEIVDGGTYRRTVSIDGEPGLLEVAPGDGPGDHLVLTAHLPYWDHLIHVVQRVRRLFDLDADPHEIGRVLGRDPLLADRVRARPGVRLPGAWDAFECGVRAIVGQQVSVAGATTLIGRIVAQFGTPAPGLAALGLDRVFPTAATLADADLRAIGMPSARATAVSRFAQAVATGEVRVDGALDLDGLVGSLVQLPGIGPWTAHYLALRLGERDAFPAGDLGLRRAMGAHGEKAAPAAVAARAESWRPWRAYAAVHLWNDVWTEPQASTDDKGSAQRASSVGGSSDHALTLSM